MLEGYYLTIDECILKGWRKAHEGDLTHLRIDRNVGNDEDDAKAFEELQNDFIRVIGIGEKFKSYLELLYLKADLELKYLKSKRKQTLSDGSYVIIRDRKMLNRIKVIEAEITKFNLERDQGMSVMIALQRLSKMQGYHISEKDITVLEYQNLLKDYSNG